MLNISGLRTRGEWKILQQDSGMDSYSRYTHKRSCNRTVEWTHPPGTLTKDPVTGLWNGLILQVHSQKILLQDCGMDSSSRYTHKRSCNRTVEWAHPPGTYSKDPEPGLWNGLILQVHTQKILKQDSWIDSYSRYTHKRSCNRTVEWTHTPGTLTKDPVTGLWNGLILQVHSQQNYSSRDVSSRYTSSW